MTFINRWFSLVAGLLFVLAAGPLHAQQSNAPTDAASPVVEVETAAPTEPASTPEEIEPRPAHGQYPQAEDKAQEPSTAEEAFELGLAGKFREACDKIEQALAENPDSEVLQESRRLLKQYLQMQEVTRSLWQKEYDYEVERIRRANVAQGFREDTPDMPDAEAFRKAIEDDLTDAYRDIGRANDLEQSYTEEARELQEDTLEAIAKASKAVQEADGLIQDRKGEFYDIAREDIRILRERLDRLEEIWQQIDPSTEKSRWAGVDRLREVESKVDNALADVEMLVAENPWKVALYHGRVAKLIAPPDVDVEKEAWYQDLLAEAERRGTKAVDEARWYDALSAYGGLEELEPANEEYKQTLERVRRHVRVLRLYGKDEDEDAGQLSKLDPEKVDPDIKEVLEEVPGGQDEDNDDNADDEEDAWKEVVSGVDADMARAAISRVGSGYVTSVDFRELTRGALESIKVLAETPQVRDTFPGLDDANGRDTFIQAIKGELQDIEQSERVDHLRLQLALNNILRYSEETVHIPTEVLVVEFTDGMLDRMDRFSAMIWPYDIINFNKSTMGKFTGIGVQITKKQGQPLRVVTPLMGTPAYEEGLRAGDIILEVDGVSTRNETVDKLVKRIMGLPGTDVELKIFRPATDQTFDVTVTRQRVDIRTVKGWRRESTGEWEYLLPGSEKIGYIRLTQFTEPTHQNFRKALDRLKERGVTSLILDLRSNPGGLLRSATSIADEFLSSGRIVYTRGRQVQRTEIDADNGGAFLEGDLVVLVDQNSASAAEILSGALKDWDRAIIVGQRSYGKGSVQNVITLRPRRAYLKLTTAYYYLPSGRLLHRKDDSEDWGVSPDVEVFITPQQTRQWAQIRRRTELLREFDPEQYGRDLSRQYQADVQLNTAVLLLEMMDLQRDMEERPKVAAGDETATVEEPAAGS